MTTGESIVLVIGGTALVGGALYLLTRTPVPAPTGAASRSLAPVAGAGIVGLFSGLGSGLVNVFGGSGSTPTVAKVASVPIPDDSAAVQSWNNTSSSTFDQLAAGDEAQGIEGPY